MSTIQNFQRARPILKWVGGKGQLLPELMKRIPGEINTYHEPFVGGGALFFELFGQEKISRAIISDINPSLIDVYLGVRDCLDDVIRLLKQFPHDEEYYYKVRSWKPEELSLPERAARLIYLNKTCYNGLFRENRAGEFNVPFGRYKNPTICDEQNLIAVSQVLKNVQIERKDFTAVLEIAQAGDFVYFDPPYYPLSTTANFTAYSRDGFQEKNQVQLRDTFVELTNRHVNVMLSNSDTSFIKELYGKYQISEVYATRAVNSKADSRGKITELVICNYPY